MKFNTNNNVRRYQDYVLLYYSVQDVAKALGVPVQKVHDLIQNGSIPYFRVGTRVLVPYKALVRFIRRTQRHVMPSLRESEP